MTKRTKARIRKSVIFARKVFLALFAVFMLLTIMAANNTSVIPALTCFAVAITCFGISYFCDYLLGGGYQSPFYH